MNLKINLSCLSLLLATCMNSQTMYENMQSNVLESLKDAPIEELDFADLLQSGSHLTRINLNSANAIELAELMNPNMIDAFNEHLKIYGQILSIYELQTIRGFDPVMIKEMLPFITVHKDMIETMRTSGILKQEIRFNNSYRPERSQGFYRTDSLRFDGNPIKQSILFDASKGDVLSFGFHAEKDAGESYNVLFGSAFFQYSDIKSQKRITIGDQNCSYAQGLFMGNGISGGKSSMVMMIMKTKFGSNPYRSFNETGFLRGLSYQCRISKHTDLSVFSGIRFQDGVISTDSFGDRVYNSIYSNGKYRNDVELSRRHSIRQTLAGFYTRYRNKGLEIGSGIRGIKSNAVSSETNRNENQSKHFGRFQDIKAAADWKWQYRNGLWFGEMVFTPFQMPSFLSGLMIATGKHSDFSLCYRNFQSLYQGEMSNAFGESSINTNEKGLYMAMSIQLSGKIKLNAYNDLCKFPGRRYRVSSTSFFNEQFLELQYRNKDQMSFYVRFRYSTQQINYSNDQNLYPLSEVQKKTIRFHLEYKIGPLRFRNRFEQNLRFSPIKPLASGMLLFQDIKYELSKRISFTTRISLFSTEDYDCRVFAYENDVPGSYSIPSFSGNGTRFYFLFRYQVNKHLKIWFRFARSAYDDRETFGSGQDMIHSRHLSDIQTQIQWKI